VWARHPVLLPFFTLLCLVDEDLLLFQIEYNCCHIAFFALNRPAAVLG
jgi:hypothetical protein